jgi:hypothetical protein
VVVDHVKEHGQPAGVSGIDKTLQRIRAAVRLVNGIQIHSIVTPSVIAGEGCHGHQFSVGDPEFSQVVEPGDGRIQRALGCERTNVQLIHDGACQWDGMESVVTPLESVLIVEARKRVHSVRLPPRTGIGIRSRILIDPVPIIRSRTC